MGIGSFCESFLRIGVSKLRMSYIPKMLYEILAGKCRQNYVHRVKNDLTAVRLINSRS